MPARKHLSSTLAIGGVEWRSDLAVMAGVSPPRDAAMPVLPSRFATVILHFAPLFYRRSWRHAEVLLIGAILAPGRGTVASLLRIRLYIFGLRARFTGQVIPPDPILL